MQREQIKNWYIALKSVVKPWDYTLKYSRWQYATKNTACDPLSNQDDQTE